MPTLDKQFDKEFPTASFTWNGENNIGKRFARQSRRKVKTWVKSYILSFMESVKLDAYPIADDEAPGNVAYRGGYNQALSDQGAKMAEELTKRGI